MRTGPLAAAGWVVAATLTLGVSWSAMQGVRTAVAPADLGVAAADSLPVPSRTAGGPTPTGPGAPSTPPSGTAPSGTAPSGTAPSGTAPSGTAPSGTAPSGTAAPPGAAPAVTAVTRSGTGGTVRVTCTAGVPQVLSAIPRQGFSAEVDDTPGEVKFTSTSRRTEVDIYCTGGRPQVEVKESSLGGDG